jgi:hypothetical protein
MTLGPSRQDTRQSPSPSLSSAPLRQQTVDLLRKTLAPIALNDRWASRSSPAHVASSPSARAQTAAAIPRDQPAVVNGSRGAHASPRAARGSSPARSSQDGDSGRSNADTPGPPRPAIRSRAGAGR